MTADRRLAVRVSLALRNASLRNAAILYPPAAATPPLAVSCGVALRQALAERQHDPFGQHELRRGGDEPRDEVRDSLWREHLGGRCLLSAAALVALFRRPGAP